MKKNYWITLIAGIAITLGIYAIPGSTQTAPPAAQLPNLVAVIDVAQVIKAHPDFDRRQKELAEQVKAAEAKFQTRQEAIATKQKNFEAAQLKPGTLEYQQASDAIANDLAEFEKDAKTLQRKFALENSKIMYDTFQDIKATIGRYASVRNIAQVTDYRVFEVNPADPPTVAEDMDQRLVWFNPNLNITSQIIGEIYAARNMPVPSTNPAPRTAIAPGAAGPAAGPTQGMQQRVQ